MPIYEYRCRKCGGEFELFRSISENGDPRCKFCDGVVEKLISRSSFHLKGSGWYVTDYGGKKSGSREDGKEASSDSPGTGKADKKEGSGSKQTGEPSSD
jgi:putative FmdB family regulatory protein